LCIEYISIESKIAIAESIVFSSFAHKRSVPIVTVNIKRPVEYTVLSR